MIWKVLLHTILFALVPMAVLLLTGLVALIADPRDTP